jgi:hypothetical protein
VTGVVSATDYFTRLALGDEVFEEIVRSRSPDRVVYRGVDRLEGPLWSRDLPGRHSATVSWANGAGGNSKHGRTRRATNWSLRAPSTSRPSTGPPDRASAGAALARLVGCPGRERRQDPHRRLRRGPSPSASQCLGLEVSPRPLGRASRGTRRRDRVEAAATRGSRPRGAALPRLRVGRAPNVDREGVQGAGDPALVAARPAPPPHLAAAPAGVLAPVLASAGGKCRFPACSDTRRAQRDPRSHAGTRMATSVACVIRAGKARGARAPVPPTGLGH